MECLPDWAEGSEYESVYIERQSWAIFFFLKKCDENSWSIILKAGNQSSEVDMGFGGKLLLDMVIVLKTVGGDKNDDKDKVSIWTGRVSQKLVARGIDSNDILKTETMGN